MKKGQFLVAAFLVCSLFSRAQGFLTLKVTDMPGYPSLPQDTAYEGVPYNFDVVLTNNTNIFISTTVAVNLRIDSAITTLLSNPAVSIPPNDSVIFQVQGYNFTQPFYKAGNNIVVVWPVVNGITVPIDTTYKDVYFVPLNSAGTNEHQGIDFQIFPIPVNHTLQLGLSDLEYIEYVRIFDTSGRLIRYFTPGEERNFDVASLVPGVYILEIRSGSRSGFGRFVKL